jgi:uncharacterized protein (DUF362 family)
VIKLHSKVAVMKTNPKTVINDLKKVMDLANYKKSISKKFETILKLNLSWSLFFPACSTSPWQLDGVIRALKEDGYNKIYPVENKTVVTDPWKGVRLNGWDSVLKKHNLKFQSLTDVKWIKYEPKHDLLVLDKIFQDGIEIPEIFINKNIIHLPTMKTHGHSIITGAIKNSFGGLLKEARHHCHKYIHEVLVDLLIIQKDVHRGIFAVMDGTIAGNGAGPRTMIPVEKNYILASNDQVALDCVSAKMMGFDPLSIPFIKKCNDIGLGCGDFEQIEVIGEDINSENWKFSSKKSIVIFFDRLLRLSFIEPLLFHTKIFKLCILGSFIYHDYFWYPFFGKNIIRKFEKTEWGKLFNSYKKA